jgi:two-component system NtrC family sensor kinase
MMHYISFLLLLMFLWQMAMTQNQKFVDSLLSEIQKVDSLGVKARKQGDELKDTIKVNLYFKIARAFLGNNPVQYLDYSNRVKQLSEEIGFKSGIALGLNSIGIYYTDKGDYAKALDCHEKALIVAEEINDKIEIQFAHCEIGLIYYNLGNYTEALKNILISLKNCQDINYQLGISANYSNLGSIYNSIGNYPEAIKNFRNSLKILSGNKWKLGHENSYFTVDETLINMTQAYDYISIGESFKNIGDTAAAIFNLTTGLDLCEKYGDKTGAAKAYQILSLIYLNQADFQRAMVSINNTINLYQDLGDQLGLGNANIIMARILIKQRKYQSAEVYLIKALSLGVEIGALPLLSEASGELSLFYANKGNYRQAYEYHVKYKASNDSIINKEKLKDITKMRMQFEFDKKESLSKAEQAKKNAIHQVEIGKERFVRNAFVSGALLLLLLLIILFNRYRFKQKANKELADAYQNLRMTQQQLVHQEKLASLGALTAGIAHEIKNPLNFVNNFAELSNELLEELDVAKDEEERAELMKTIRQNLLKINEHGRRADGIVKSMLEHSRSGQAEKQPTDINKLCEEYLNLAFHGKRALVKDFNCTIEKHFAQDLPMINAVPQDISRVILNLVNNAFDAMNEKPDAKLEITTESVNQPINGVKISIRDNGSGMSKEVQQKIFEPFFTTKPTGQGTGLGLSLSFDIIKAHGGHIEVYSEEGRGTEFTLTLPK